MANPRHAGRKRKLNAGDGDQAYQRRQTKEFKKLQKGLKEVQQTAPSYLDAHGKWLWRQIVPELKKIGNVKWLDEPNIIALCSAYSDFRTASEEIAANGPYAMFLAKDGAYHQDKSRANPMFAVKNTAERTMKTLSADLGMSFNARAAANIESEHYHAAEPKPSNPLKIVKFNV
ncbi:MAG: phage terminase small subunit P27 family [Lactobacillus sp.]|nr:phage terminase small subunit P27 family [Lactobacillus sp.]MCH4067967.1 phage terminase small subunit P27 family [Lactobacillus sp.]MCI1304077.1 phage terminase small subunit P27 family [Lactobacillus sp.]MCI1329897.1 phage terminase small subunit P27 family [Lactobacillus sp.]MCI1399497.1 phage terminase small subunit P27 family [Lactobacillus sp.]